jgi:4-alpha-glucanotransferase
MSGFADRPCHVAEPAGIAATDGCYVIYPFDELVRLVALESCQQSCAVTGEDLGTVLKGFEERCGRPISCPSHHDRGAEPRLRLRISGRMPPLAAAWAATHDLATLAGFLARPRYRLASAARPIFDATTERSSRPNASAMPFICCGRSSPRGVGPGFRSVLSEAGEPTYSPELDDAIRGYFARLRTWPMLVQLEDAVDESEQANLLGTIDGIPIGSGWTAPSRRSETA